MTDSGRFARDATARLDALRAGITPNNGPSLCGHNGTVRVWMFGEGDD